MTTNHSAKQPVPPAKVKSPLIPAFAAVTALFLMTIGYLLFQNSDKNTAIEQKVAELQEAYQLQAELEFEYNDALTDLEAFRVENESLAYLIDEQEAQLKQQKDKISGLLREGKNLKKARAEMSQLKVQVEQYLAEIKDLRNENFKLSEENEFLYQDREVLAYDLKSQIESNTELNEAKAVLVSQRDEMSKTIHLASVIKVTDIEISGIKTKSSGKSVARKSAKNIDHLQVCFQTTANEIVQPGVEKFFIRIVNPLGETLAIENLGSGSITNNQTGEDIRFTQYTESDYENNKQDICFIWESNASFQAGTYDVEIYNKGYLAGTNSFTLK